ncbi:hypothetical protein PEL8287_00398 [Roseovarius litorisediminis]|uniref:Uncharacterized protein n=1 Tax=Roseovarius litorisediminis TaxID=1312363 RepID=A0A1Y5RBP6_9RHOB|nr:hypothetical protein PEL8287_00398 [Roseovarius litorisediminis]
MKMLIRAVSRHSMSGNLNLFRVKTRKRPLGLFLYYLPVGLADLVIGRDAMTVTAIRQQAKYKNSRKKDRTGGAVSLTGRKSSQSHEDMRQGMRFILTGKV